MMQMKKYFAAANGYDGFISYFDKVFDPMDFTRIYLLKGGPGTGKSSLMREILRITENRGAICESILCSSDINSLDGIICQNGNNRIAIIDGTAPHERDTVIPGAVDELINLGDNWDKRWLSARRKEISDLNTEKKLAYATAYSYLKIAGCSNREARKFALTDARIKNLKNAAKHLAESIACSPGKQRTRLISSFGKQGAFRLEGLDCSAKKCYTLIGDEWSASIFLNHICDVFALRSAKMTVLPSPLERSDLDAVFIDGDGVVISRTEGGEIIDLRELSDFDALTDERIKIMRATEAQALESAKRWFGIASDFHFRLEEIYKTSMDFDKNKTICDEKTEEISEILEL